MEQYVITSVEVSILVLVAGAVLRGETKFPVSTAEMLVSILVLVAGAVLLSR